MKGKSLCIPPYRQGIRVNGPTVTIVHRLTAPAGTYYNLKPKQRAYNVTVGSVLIKRN